jgi:hypothetical protein
MSQSCGLYGPFVHPRVICDVDHGWYWLGLTPSLSTGVLWQPPVLSGGPVSRDISVAAPSTGCFPASRDISGSYQYSLVFCHLRHLWSEWEVGESNENLVYSSPWNFKRSFTCRKILLPGTSGFLALLPIWRKVCCGFLSPLEIHRLGQARTHNLRVQWQAH